MGGFDDIFESIDDITAPAEDEKEQLTVSEAEAVTGVWNANDDGNVWSSGSTPSSPRVWNANDNQKSGYPKEKNQRIDDDWVEEDEILEDFVDEDDSGGGMFDDIF